jgi:llaI.2
MFKQKIYFGAPGTGKSFQINEEIKGVPEEDIFRTVIHPEFTYSDFVGQLLPYKNDTGTGFEFFPGVLTQALKKAYFDRAKTVYLILEEISRGNVSAIFGDIFQLLDRNESFESEYPIRNDNITAEIPQITDGLLKFPSNLNIICSVNTNDQNVFPMDTAFKRRFDWVYVSTKPAVDALGKRLSKLNNPRINIINDKDNIETNWQSFYFSLNKFITDKNDGLGLNEDKQIGQFFLKFDNSIIEESYNESPKPIIVQKINKTIKDKLLLYLWQDINGAVAFSKNQLFDSSIATFDDLYEKFEVEKVFSKVFIEEVLETNKNKFPYEG